MLSPSTIRFAARNLITGEFVLSPMISPPVIWIVLDVAPSKPEQLRLDFNVPFPVTVTLPSIFPSNTTAFSSMKPAVSIVISSQIESGVIKKADIQLSDGKYDVTVTYASAGEGTEENKTYQYDICLLYTSRAHET